MGDCVIGPIRCQSEGRYLLGYGQEMPRQRVDAPGLAEPTEEAST